MGAYGVVAILFSVLLCAPVALAAVFHDSAQVRGGVLGADFGPQDFTINGTLDLDTLRFIGESTSVTSLSALSTLGGGSASNSTLPTQWAVKAYVDSQISGSGTMSSFTIAGDTGSTVITDGETITIAGGVGINTSESAGVVSIGVTPSSIGPVQLANTAVTAGSYGSSSGVGVFTVDSQGRLTSASDSSIAIGAGQVTSGTLGVARGGTGISSFTTGNYVRASGATSLEQRTPAQVRSDIGAGTGSVTSVAVSGGSTGLTTSGGPITDSGTITLGGTLAVGSGGTGSSTASGARSNLGATTVGSNLFTLPNPGAIRFVRLNADDSVSALDAASFRSAIGAGTGSVTSVGTGIGLTGGPITSSGTIDLADTAVTAGSYGSSSEVGVFTVDSQGRLTSASDSSIAIGAGQVTSGTLGVARGGTGISGAGGTANRVLLTTDGASWSAGQVDLASAQIDGILPIGAGGTGVSSVSARTVLIGGSSAGAPSWRVLADADLPSSFTGKTYDGLSVSTGTSTFTLTRGSATLTRSGAHALTLTTTGASTLTLPSGTRTVAATGSCTGGNYVSATSATGVTCTALPSGGGTVTSVNASGGSTGLTVSGGPITTSGTLTLGGTLAVGSGGTGSSTASGARSNLGATTVGSNLFTLPNPGAIRFVRLNADDSVSALDAASFRSDIGAGTGSVTSVGTGTGLTGGPITSSGTIDLANTAVTAGSYGSSSEVGVFTVDSQGRLTSASDSSIAIGAGQVTSGTLGVARGGTGISSFTTGNYVRASGATSLEQRTPAQVRSDIGAGTGSVTSVAVSGGSTGLTTSGGPITDSGTITLGGTLAVGSGGTGVSSVSARTVLIGGSSAGAPSWRVLADADLPSSFTGKTYDGLSVSTGTSTFTLTRGSATLTRSGAHALTLTTTGASTLTLPSGTRTVAATGSCTGGNYVSATSATGVSCTALPASGGTPGGSSGNVQYNSGGSFAGTNNLHWDNTNSRLGVVTSSPSYNLHVVGTFYASGSSAEYKENITNYTSGAERFMQLRPVTYDYREEYRGLGLEFANGSRQIGLIAEEVAELYPELAIVIEEEGEKVVRNVDYEKLTIILLEELQNLRGEHEALKSELGARIEALERG